VSSLDVSRICLTLPSFRLVNDYLRDNFFTRQSLDRSSLALNIAACRLILIIMPGLETSAVFQVSNDQLINRLYDWAENSEEPLRSYATGLLGAAMDIQDIAVAFREQNIRMLPLLLQRLRSIQTKFKRFGNVSSMSNGKVETPERPFSHLGSATTSAKVNGEATCEENEDNEDEVQLFSGENSQSTQERSVKKFMIPLYPPTLATSQMMILRYLTPMGEYQEFLPFIFEGNAMEIIFNFLENVDPNDLCLAFEALKYLASLLCHKKCCIEFLSRNGLLKLLKLPRQSTVATGIAIALYYIAYCEEAMERICSMTPRLISELVGYALGLLGCNHDSGRCHATMFFGLSFQFKVMLDEFDKQDGLRKLYNVISVLPILSHPSDDNDLSVDEENAERQVVRHVCVALKKYFESHLFYKFTQVHRLASTRMTTPTRALKNPSEIIDDQILTLQGLLPMKSNWSPVSEFLQLGGVTLFILIIAHSYEWNYSGRGETVRSALDVLNICCVVPRVHAVFCERIDFPEEASAAGLNIILGAAEGEIVADPEVQKSALSLLVNCICAPIYRPSGVVGRYGSAKKKIVDKNSEELIKSLWETVRANNGIIVLLQLMTVKTPITDADCIRGMACRALAGLARSETVRQIISKLPLFVNGQLQQLMRDPILQEKRAEHVQFQKYALELLERVSGKPINIDTSLANIHKANVVAQTKIQFNEQQLYLLIHKHLTESGLTSTADMLIKEAKLESVLNQQRPPISSTSSSPFIHRTPLIQRSRIRRIPEASICETEPCTSSDLNKSTASELTASEAIASEASSFITPIKLIKKAPPPTPSSTSSTLEKQVISDDFLTATTPAATTKIPPKSAKITLNTIITEYLTNQHSLCKNPMSTCPQFDLFKPHKCPDPRPNRNLTGTSVNVAARFFKRHQGFNSVKLDRRFVHSNFHAARTLKIPDLDLCFTTCDFTPDASSLMIGTHNGEVRVFHINDSTEDFSASCSDSYINNIKCSRDGRMVLTSSTWHTPLSVLWSVENKQFVSKLNFNDDEYVEFSNLEQNKVLGTKGEKATIYDINTGQSIRSLNPTIFNQYNKNRATFCPTDELILSDGVLWDFRSSQQIHKFDKLNNTLSGIFHPNGLEVVSNTEVWDLRTFHLLRTIPTLDQCQVKFSPQNVMYAFSTQTETMEEERGYDSSFKVLDSYDYSSISTTDVRKSIYDLAVNNNGCQIALCENQGGYESVSESVVRVYTVGRKRDPEDDPEEEDEEMGSEEDDGLDDSVSENDDNGKRSILTCFFFN
jgi:DDB1- and CUL4-associated factor 1